MVRSPGAGPVANGSQHHADRLTDQLSDLERHRERYR